MKSKIFRVFVFSCTNLPLYTSNQLGTGQEQTNLEKLATCKNSLWNKTAIFVTIGVIVSLALFLLIIHSVRIIYKPLRPRIKKTYVVHKSVRPTPLTCRPATEQCEITIENCCNMNICDTVSVICNNKLKLISLFDL